MNTLLDIRTNILYAKKKKKDKAEADEFIKHHELILLVDKPQYTHTNAGDIVRSRGVDELRFIVSKQAFEALIEALIELKDIDEEKLA